MGPTAEWREQRKESVNWETEQQKLTWSEKQRENRLKKKNQKTKQSLRDLWGYNRRSNICVMGVSEGEERGQAEKVPKEIMV